MPRVFANALSASLALSLSIVPPLSAQQIAPDFTLKDQYDVPFSLSGERGRLVLLMSSDRKGSQYVGHFRQTARSWRAERAERGDTAGLRVVAIANLDGVPRLFRGSVRGRFTAKEPDGRPTSPILLECTVTVAKLYRARPDVTSVWLVAPDGALLWSGGGTGTAEEQAALHAALDSAAARAIPTDQAMKRP